MAINFTPGQQPSTVNKAARAIMGTVTRNVTPPKAGVTRNVTQEKRIEALEQEVAELRVIHTQILDMLHLSSNPPRPAATSRAEYMREYRKRRKG